MPEAPNPKLRETPPPAGPARASALAYAELDVKSNFSFLRGASHPDELVYRAAELGYRAIAITDFNSLAGVVRAHEAAKESGVQLLVGARLVLADAPDLLVWAPNRSAYARLCRLLTLGKRRAEKGQCLLYLRDVLDENAGLLVALVGHCPPGGNAGAQGAHYAWGQSQPAEAQLAMLREAMGDRLSLAASCAYGPDDVTRLHELAKLSRRYDVPMLAVNDVYYHEPARRMLQDVLTCVHQGCCIREAGFSLFPNGERYLKSPEQMHRLFADFPGAIRRGLELAERCTFKLDELRYEYPDELSPQGKTSLQYLAELAWNGAADRYPAGIPEKVRRLLAHELELIERLNFEHYFLTVYDIVTFARSRGILCQGRGSAANSAVCYCLGVTAVDPDRIDLLFERFISAARGEPPDIDIDFEHERREEVLQYLYDKYGRDRAAMTAEVITYRGRSAVRDVGKAMGLSLDMVDSLAGKLDWWNKGVVSDEQIRETGLDPADLTIRQVMALSTLLLGFPRHLSQHVGGMVMTRGPLCEMVPIENASMDDRTVIEWDKDDIDALGILKVDILALGMLTCIAKAFVLAEEWDQVGREGEKRRKGQGSSSETLSPVLRGEGRLRGRTSNDWEFQSVSRFTSSPQAADVGSASADARASVEQYSWQRTIPSAKADPTSAPSSAEFQNASTLGPSPQPSPPSTGEREKEITPLLPLSLSPLLPLTPSPPLRAARLQLHTLPPNDMAVYDMISRADTVGVFQIESRAQMSMLPRLRPRCFYDLVIEVAIVRPGPIQGDMVHPYLRRRAGLEPVTFPSAALRKVLEKTLGVPLFQEQAMRVAMVGAGFSAEEADKLRRVMAAWRRTGAIETFHQKIVDGMLANGYTREFAEQCFNQIKGFGEYGFPESHAASFASLVYASAWLKHHYPAVFAAALLNSQPMGFYMPAQIVRDAKEHGVPVHPVDVNASHWDCTLERPALRLGFRQVKGFRQDHAKAIVAARSRAGRFTSIAQFHRLTALKASSIRILAEADAFGSLGLSRREALWMAMQLKDEHYPLFDDLEAEESPVELPPMSARQEVMTDYATAGLSLKRHPVSLVREALAARKIITSAELGNMEHNRWVKVAGLVLIRQRPGTASGVVFETLEDETGIINLIVHPAIYDRYRPAARHASLLQADGYVQRQGQIIHVLPKRLTDLSGLLGGYEQKSRDFH